MSQLAEKREELGAKHKLMERVLREAGNDYDFTKVEALGDDLDTQGKVDEFRKLNRELDDLTAECKQLEMAEIGENVRAVREVMAQPAPVKHAASSASGFKSIGAQFTESDVYTEFKRDRSSAQTVSMTFPEVEIKTLMATTAGFAPPSDRTGIVVEAVTRPIQVLDLIPVLETDSNSVTYMSQTLRTVSAAEKIEGATYAESAYEWTEKTSPVRKITDSIPVTDEQLEDVSQMRGLIDQQLAFGLRQRLDGQVITGTGVPPLLEGILNVTGIQTQAKSTDPRFDAIHKAMTKVRVTGRAMPNAIVLHPNDWEAIRLTRTADGLYILGNPAQVGPMTLFGVPVVQGDVITENTGLVGDFANYCALFDRRGVDIQAGFSGTQFVEGKQTLRADLRAAFVVFRPAAFCTVTGL
jgi:HK97 family phage major capsid protein